METAMSPKPEKAKEKGKELRQYTFFDAMKEILDGKKVTKLEWGDEEYYGMFKDEQLTLHKPDKKFYSWIISVGDMTGTDYIII